MSSKDKVQLCKRCYMDVAIGETPAGRIVIELFDNVVPKTAENFRGICTAEYGVGQVTGKKLSYVGVLFHRVIPGFMVQAGDFSAFDGTGGESIYGGKFEDENLKMKHDRPYLVSMANAGRDLNGSQFFITTVPCPSLDGKHVVFGHVIAGQQVVKAIENTKTDANDRPLEPVKIVKCGELVPVFPATSKKSQKKDEKKKKKRAKSESDSSSSDSVEDLEEKRKAKKAKRVQKDAAKAAKKLAKEEANKPAAPEAYCTIRAEEIPHIPENKFLARRTSPRPVVLMAADSTNSKLEPAATERNDMKSAPGNREERPYFSRASRRDEEGITIKGRGAVRYSRRSATPPHWHTRPVNLPFRAPERQSRPADASTRISSRTTESARDRREEVSSHAKKKHQEGSHDKRSWSGERNRPPHTPVDKQYSTRRTHSQSAHRSPSRKHVSLDHARSPPSPANHRATGKGVDLFALGGYSRSRSRSPRRNREREDKSSKWRSDSRDGRNPSSSRTRNGHAKSAGGKRDGSRSHSGGRRRSSPSREKRRRSRSASHSHGQSGHAR